MPIMRVSSGGLVVLLSSLMLTGCVFSMPTYRYEMTVEVDTPEGVRSGSSVIEVQSQSQPLLHNGTSSLTGEAAVIDLGKRGKLFALLRSDDDTDWGKRLFANLAQSDPSKTDTRSMRGNVRNIIADKDTHVLPRRFEPLSYLREKPGGSGYPMLVRFDDPRQPRSVRYVSPENLAGSFGDGVRLRRITVKITDKPVTEAIGQTLPWLNDPSGQLDGQNFSENSIKNLANFLSAIAFKREHL